MMFRKITLEEGQALPFWRRPVTLLFLMAAALPIAFSTWFALLNNFVIEVASFDGADIGLLHSIREIPGFLAVGVIAIIIFVREQVLGVVSLLLLAVTTAVTAWFPTLGGILTITFLSSIGFHYYETVNQSLQLQWIDKARAPKVLGWMSAAASASTLVIYVLIVLTWEKLGLSYNFVFLISGGITAAVAVFCLVAYPQFESPTPQIKKMLGTQKQSMAPNDLLQAILKMKTDLLWNGGIGTYVKGSKESHLEVGDRANDVLRINGCELQAKVVGEGGNLGLTAGSY